jgi:hypothetical protein
MQAAARQRTGRHAGPQPDSATWQQRPSPPPQQPAPGQGNH